MTTLFFGAIALIAFFWALPSLFRVNKYEDEIDGWPAIDYRYHMNSQGTNSGQPQGSMFGWQMYHPFEVTKQAYDLEERRLASHNKQVFYVIVLIAVCVAATYLLKDWGII